MFGNAVEICLIFCRILGPLVSGWAPNHFVLGAQQILAKKGKSVSLRWVVVSYKRKYVWEVLVIPLFKLAQEKVW